MWKALLASGLNPVLIKWVDQHQNLGKNKDVYSNYLINNVPKEWIQQMLETIVGLFAHSFMMFHNFPIRCDQNNVYRSDWGKGNKEAKGLKYRFRNQN